MNGNVQWLENAEHRLVVHRAKGPAVYLAQPEGLGYRQQNTKRANGPAVTICNPNYYPFNPWPKGQAVRSTGGLALRPRTKRG